MKIHTIYAPIFRNFRAKRMRRFYEEMRVTGDTTIIDIGGTPFNWLLAVEIGLPVPRKVLLVNLESRTESLPAWMQSIEGDATNLTGIVGDFDIAFSNSVIEHLGTYRNQQQMGRQVARLAGRFWVQTPDPRFPVEPHYLAPFVHWIPRQWRGIAARLTPWWWIAHPTRAEIRDRLEEIRLMTARELTAVFPDAEIVVERFFGWPKALVAVKRYI